MLPDPGYSPIGIQRSLTDRVHLMLRGRRQRKPEDLTTDRAAPEVPAVRYALIRRN